MTTFDEREQAFEKKFAVDQELAFRAKSRRDKLLAQWAGAAMGLSAAEIEDYIMAIRHTDIVGRGNNEVLAKIRADFDAKGVAITDAAVGQKMAEFLAQAMAEIDK